MPVERWRLETRIRASLVLLKREHVKSGRPFHPTIRQMRITPEFSDEGKQLGSFAVAIDFDVELKSNPHPSDIADVGRDIFARLVSLISFLTGRPVVRIDPINLRNDQPDGKSRYLFLNPESAQISPPVPLGHQSFDIPLDEPTARVLALYSHALADTNVVSSTMFMIVALEFLASQHDVDLTRTETCASCGAETHHRAGTGQKFQHVVQQTGTSETIAKSLWDLRNDLLHGRFRNTAANRRELHARRSEVQRALVRSMKAWLSLGDQFPPPDPEGEWISDAFLDISTSPAQEGDSG